MATANAARPNPYMDARRGNNHRKTSSVVCKFWLAGRCNRNPCYFAHQSFPQIQDQSRRTSFLSGVGPVRKNHRTAKQSWKGQGQQSITISAEEEEKDTASSKTPTTPKNVTIEAAEPYDEDRRVCTHWMSGTCIHADKCRFLHSWVSTKAVTDIERVTEIKEHKKDITGIAFPSGCQIMFTGSKDGTLRSWDVPTGRCTGHINVGGEVGCVICHGSWVFVGVENAIWAWNTDGTSPVLSLEGPVGLVHALVFCHETLFAACEDGNILAYKRSPEQTTFTQIATLGGHSDAVLSLVAMEQVYSGSKDCQIRVWHPDTLQCTHILEGHSGAVTSLVVGEGYLFSGSLDKTFKIWEGTEDHDIREVHTCYMEQGVIAFMGMTDAAKRPVLFASCEDNSVHLYEVGTGLPDRGRLFTKKQVTTITHCGRQIFTGDASGNLHVWKWLGQPSS